MRIHMLKHEKEMLEEKEKAARVAAGTFKLGISFFLKNKFDLIVIFLTVQSVLNW